MEYTTSDTEYLRHGTRALTARVYRPKGDGPFPAVIDIHGGAWSGGDLTDGEERDRALAAAGFLVAALEFRHGEDGYPTSLADINFAIRWLKSGASGLPVRADRVGLTGNSSGGHLAMLAAMRPSDPRYAALPLPGGKRADATIQCVAMLWPVINPLSRFRHARRARDTANPPAWVGNIPERQQTYWKSEAAMEEGNPMLALERGEAVQTPPAIWVQGRPSDPPHDYHDPDGSFAGNEPERFVANYRKRGGQIELVDVDQAARGPGSVAPVLAFFRRHLGG